MAATQQRLEGIVAACARPQRPLRGAAVIGQRVGRVINRYKMAKHFQVTITDTGLSYRCREASLKAEEALDGLYVVRTDVPAQTLDSAQTVAAYKSLSTVERAFRTMKSVNLHIRPIYHYLETRVRAHVLLCMLAYYVEWHMRQALAPITFHDAEPEAAERASVVAPAGRSAAARTKAASQRSVDDLPVHSFPSLLDHLATQVKNWVQLPGPAAPPFATTTRPTPLQRRAFELLNLPLPV